MYTNKTIKKLPSKDMVLCTIPLCTFSNFVPIS